MSKLFMSVRAFSEQHHTRWNLKQKLAESFSAAEVELSFVFDEWVIARARRLRWSKRE